MSYTEYLRRKAASAPKIVDTTIRSDASTITMRRRLAANYEFAIGARQGVINNVADPSQTGTTSNPKAVQMTTKVSGGRVPDASLFTSYLGGQALDKDGGPFQKPQRYTLNSNTSGSLSGCATVDEPAPALPTGTLIGTISLNLTSLSASGTTLTVGFSPYTINTSQKQYRPGIGRNIVISGELSTLSLTGFTNTAGVVTATTASTAGIQNGTVVTISGGTASAGNLGTFTVTSFVANTSITYTNASGVTEATTATATFVSPNNGTYAITSVVNATTVTVTNANAITEAVVTGTVLVPIVVSGNSANAVPQNAGQIAMTAQSCRYPSTEGHVQSELGPALFVDNTIRLKHLVGCTTNEISDANHTHPADVSHNTTWAPRPKDGNGGIPVFTVASPSDARKVGDRNPRNIPYVEKHHGTELRTSFPRVPRKYVIPGQPPAQLKINDPRHYPVA